MEKTEELKRLRKKFLSDCKPEWAFWLHNSKIVRNIHELADAIENMDNETFIYHVNDDNKKNDFALWIRAVLDDDKLADLLSEVRDKELYAELIRRRINEFQTMEFLENQDKSYKQMIEPEPFF